MGMLSNIVERTGSKLMGSEGLARQAWDGGLGRAASRAAFGGIVGGALGGAVKATGGDADPGSWATKGAMLGGAYGLMTKYGGISGSLNKAKSAGLFSKTNSMGDSLSRSVRGMINNSQSKMWSTWGGKHVKNFANSRAGLGFARGAVVGAGAGAVYGGINDRESMLSGAFKGALVGGAIGAYRASSKVNSVAKERAFKNATMNAENVGAATKNNISKTLNPINSAGSIKFKSKAEREHAAFMAKRSRAYSPNRKEVKYGFFSGGALPGPKINNHFTPYGD